jgi:hypothetical protein
VEDVSDLGEGEGLLKTTNFVMNMMRIAKPQQIHGK